MTVAQKNRVLLVDDEPDVVYLVKTALERNGFEVDAYTDPILALHNFRTDIYRLLLLDIKMPKMDGIELFKKMEIEDDRVRVCFFSASDYLTSNCKNVFQDPNRFLFISKPISLLEMTRSINRFVASHD